MPLTQRAKNVATSYFQLSVALVAAVVTSRAIVNSLGLSLQCLNWAAKHKKLATPAFGKRLSSFDVFHILLAVCHFRFDEHIGFHRTLLSSQAGQSYRFWQC